MNINIMTIGTRGDVQPYIALAVGLKSAGHMVTIATLEEFRELVSRHGLLLHTLRGDFLKAAQLQQGQKNRNQIKLMRQYIDMAKDTLADEWESAQKADVLIYNPAAIGGYHIAEKLDIPTFAAFPTPMYSPTREFPNPFLPFSNLGLLNKLSHHFFLKIGPAMYRGPINQFRKNTLNLQPSNGESKLHGKPVTKLYSYSPAVVPTPADWDQSSIVTGYWFLDTTQDWQPDSELLNFLQDGPTPVYIGFGSMYMNTGKQKTEIVLQALKLSGQRAILATGWGGLSENPTSKDIFVVDAIPHDWLFPQVTVVIHHGGAGTTGASLLAGKPQVICPFVGDQFFWGRRIADLRAGTAPVPQSKLSAETLADAINLAISDSTLKQTSIKLAETISAERGVEQAVKQILTNVN